MDELTPMFGNVYTVFDFIIRLLGGIDNISMSLQNSIGGFFAALNPFS